MRPTRRSVLATILAIPPAALMRGGAADAQESLLNLAPTPSCGAETVSQTAGPFYTPKAPLKRSLLADARGQPITLAGFVVDVRCKPIPGALVEIWHADDQGAYDNAGFRLRGHQFTDEAGRWGFTTIVTRHYANRTSHYHFRVQPPGGRLLTTQLYFPDDPRNKTDSLFDSRLVLKMQRDDKRQIGRFDFVV